MKVLLGIKISKAAFLKEWPGGIEEAFDRDAYRVKEIKGMWNDYEIVSNVVFDFKEWHVNAIQNLFDFFAMPFVGIIRKADEFPEGWELLEE